MVQPELQLNFSRGSEELTLELRHDIATAEFLVITHRRDAGGASTENVDRFGDVDQAMAYLRFVEGRLIDDTWIRTEPGLTEENDASDDISPIDETTEEAPDRPIAQLFRINIPAPTLTEPALPPFPPLEPLGIEATFPEESPFIPESRFESKLTVPSPRPEVPSAPSLVADPAAPSPEVGDLGASYALERPLYCPHCREWIRTILVVRLSRMQVRFTSTLPPSGRALACSACQSVLSL